ncbi:hypothetical protein K7432_018093 [Basidiobolus ranarum]|uniref:Uncharacterized protein n=1 Tax=Basidiobolus ranarum TaxID=34480 RepID=A0ABR2WCK6_9FUNG
MAVPPSSNASTIATSNAGIESIAATQTSQIVTPALSSDTASLQTVTPASSSTSSIDSSNTIHSGQAPIVASCTGIGSSAPSNAEISATGTNGIPTPSQCLPSSEVTGSPTTLPSGIVGGAWTTSWSSSSWSTSWTSSHNPKATSVQ